MVGNNLIIMYFIVLGLFSNMVHGFLGMRTYLPFFGPSCTQGCPSHFCDDDVNIVYGYCCGCAGYFDQLPVMCSPFMKCPINTYELCQRYEYMTYCCC